MLYFTLISTFWLDEMERFDFFIYILYIHWPCSEISTSLKVRIPSKKTLTIQNCNKKGQTFPLIVSFWNYLILFNHPCHHPFYGPVHFTPLLRTQNLARETGWSVGGAVRRGSSLYREGTGLGLLKISSLHSRSPQQTGSLSPPPPRVTKYSGGPAAD